MYLHTVYSLLMAHLLVNYVIFVYFIYETKLKHYVLISSLQENKTPYELAVEQNHSDVASMIADYRDGGIAALGKYEKKRRTREQGREKPKNTSGPRTSMQEAAELSRVIQHTAGLMDKRKEHDQQKQVYIVEMCTQYSITPLMLVHILLPS